MILEIYTLLNKWLLSAQFRVWLHTHTMEEFEARMIASGCTATHTRNSTIFTTPNGLGKIEVTDSEVIVNGKAAALAMKATDSTAVCPLCKSMTPHSYKRHLEELSR
jgi:hypothetical protein